MIKAAVIGHPIKHSLSPKIHQYWLNKYDIKGQYSAIDVAPDDLNYFINSLDKNGFSGVNATIPHKEKIFALFEQKNLSDAAQKIGAVNTINITNGVLYGHNTDHIGFWLNIENAVKSRNKAVIIGAGGAARAICYALKNNGFEQVLVVNRTFEKSQKLADDFDIIAEKWEDRSNILDGCDLLINSTSLGMVGNDVLDISLAKLPQSALVNDIVYNPLMTNLLQKAQDNNNRIIDGLGMLLYQAAPAFKMWFDPYNHIEGLPIVNNDLRNNIA